MEQIIEQVIAQLQAVPGEARTQQPIYTAVHTALVTTPEDLADWQRFAANPERNESAARYILKQRLASDPALLQQLRALLGLATSGQGRSHTANVGGSAKIGNLIVGDHHGNITVGSMDFSDNKRTIVAPSGQGKPTTSGAPTARPSLPETLSADGVHFSYGHALLIGVGTYEIWGLNAPKTEADANQLAALLQDQGVAAYPEHQVRVLSGSSATRQGILDALDAFAQQLAAAPQPTAVLFFAGHGEQQGGTYYLLPHDYDRADIANSAISAALFHEKVAAIRQHAQKLVVLLNCCHSGGVGDEVLDAASDGETTDTPPIDFYKSLVAGSGQVVISAAKAAQKAGARSTVDSSLTVFGAQLVAAIKGAAPGAGAGVGVLDLFAFLSAHVPPDAAGITYKGKPLAQHPLLYAHQVDLNFALALRPNWQGGTLGSETETLILELADLEIQLASYENEVNAPAELVERRNQLLAQFG